MSLKRIGSVVALLLAGGAAFFLWAEPEASPAAAEADASSAGPPPAVRGGPSMPPAAPSAGRVAGCHFEQGDARSYRITTSTSAQIDPSLVGLPADQPTPDLTQTTTMVMDIEALHDTRDGGAVILARFREIESRALSRPEQLGAPFLLNVAADCGLEGFARLDTTPLGHARQQQALAHELHFRWPSEGSAEGEGQNGLGIYRARYGFLEAEGGAIAQRRVLGYADMWQSQGSMTPGFASRPAESLLTVRVGQGPWFAAMNGFERLEGDGSGSSTRLEVSSLTPRSGALEALPRDARRYVWEDLLPRTFPMRAARPVTGRDRARQAAVSHLTVIESVAQYQARVESGAGFQDTWPPLTDYLEARPEAAVPLIHMIQDAEIAPEATAGVYVALGRARTEEARQVLFEVARDARAPAFERARAMFALVDRDDVGVEVAEYFGSQTQAITHGGTRGQRVVGRHSMLALGALAGLQHDADITSVATEAVEQVLGEAESGVDARPAFGAIGNMGDPSLLAMVEPYTRHPDWEMRRAAVHALRRMQPSDVGELVSAWLGRERHPLVKRRLYRTLMLMSVDTQAPAAPTVIARAIEDLAEQPSHITRKVILRLLGRVADENDAARLALRAQIPLELSAEPSLYGLVADFLSPGEIRAGIAERGL